CASLTSATPTDPRADRGAARRSHDASPGARTRRPRASVTRTVSLGSGPSLVRLWPGPDPAFFATRLAGAIAVRELLVGLDDLLDQLVAHDVAFVEVHERDAVDRAHDLHRLDEPRRPAGRQIDLRDVAGDDRLRAEPEPREEHLHLLGRRVLRLVED